MNRFILSIVPLLLGALMLASNAASADGPIIDDPIKKPECCEKAHLAAPSGCNIACAVPPSPTSIPGCQGTANGTPTAGDCKTPAPEGATCTGSGTTAIKNRFFRCMSATCPTGQYGCEWQMQRAPGSGQPPTTTVDECSGHPC